MEKNGTFNAASSLNKLWNTKYYKNEVRFNDVYSRNDLPKKVKHGAYVINLDKYTDVGTQWIGLFWNWIETVYLDSFGVENVLEEVKKLVGNKNIIAAVFWVQAKGSVMCGYFCVGFIDFMLEADWFFKHVFSL